MTAQMPESSTQPTTLYNQDFVLWLEETARLFRENRLTELDVSNLLPLDAVLDSEFLPD